MAWIGTSPADTWSIKNGHYKHWKTPKKQSGTSKLPKIKGDVRSMVVSAVDKHDDTNDAAPVPTAAPAK